MKFRVEVVLRFYVSRQAMDTLIHTFDIEILDFIELLFFLIQKFFFLLKLFAFDKIDSPNLKDLWLYLWDTFWNMTKISILPSILFNDRIKCFYAKRIPLDFLAYLNYFLWKVSHILIHSLFLELDVLNLIFCFWQWIMEFEFFILITAFRIITILQFSL